MRGRTQATPSSTNKPMRTQAMRTLLHQIRTTAADRMRILTPFSLIKTKE